MSPKQPQRPSDDHLESLAHDLLGVNLNAPDDSEEPLEVEGLGLDDLGFGQPDEGQAAPTPAAAPAAPSESTSTGTTEEDDPLAWIVKAAKAPPAPAPAPASAAIDDWDDDFGAGLVDEPERPRQEAPQRLKPEEASEEVEAEVEAELEPVAEVPPADEYWDLLEGWNEWDEKPAASESAERPQRRGDRRDRPRRGDRRGGSRSDSGRSEAPRRESQPRGESVSGQTPRPERRERKPREAESREAAPRRREESRAQERRPEKPRRPEPAPPVVEEDDFGAGLLGEPDVFEDRYLDADVSSRIPEPEEEEDFVEETIVESAEEPFDADAFGAGLDVEERPAPRQRGDRRRPPRRRRAQEESAPESVREPASRPRRPQPEAESGEVPVSNKEKYANIPTWEHAISLLVRKQPRPSGGRRGGGRGGDDRRGRGGSRDRDRRGGGGRRESQ